MICVVVSPRCENSCNSLAARLQDSVKDRHDPNVTLFTGVRYVAADDIWLSPQYQRANAVISMIVSGDVEQVAVSLFSISAAAHTRVRIW